jgi:2-dehydropantoate 2-reductase
MSIGTTTGASTARIGIFGAGSVGCYLGGRLLGAGARVIFIGRERVGVELHRYGLRLSDHLGSDLRIPPDRIDFGTDARLAGTADLVLVTVKSAATAAAGAALARALQPGTPVISFQNGMHNPEALRAAMPGQDVSAGIVGFNVLNRGSGHFHQGSDGRLDAQRSATVDAWRDLFQRAGIPLSLHEDLVGLQWAKLQINLNNAINALSDLPLQDQLGRRGFRRCLALAQRELLAALDATGRKPARLTPIPPRWMPSLLELPDAIFRRVARRSLAIDPLARSSMWEDLQAGRTTEVDVLNGEVVLLAHGCGRSAPVNAKLVELVHEAERGGRRRWSADELLDSLLAGQ